MKKRILGLAGAAVLALGFASSASALTAGQIVQGVGTNQNQGVNAVYGRNTQLGWFAAQIFLTGTADIEVLYFGSEAGFKNQFFFKDSLVATTPGGSNSFSNTGTLVGTFNGVTGGLLDFFFRINGGNGGTQEVSNGTNPNTGGAPDFFASLAGSTDVVRTSSGMYVDLWLDDGGTDDNHDDMMVRVQIKRGDGFNVVPIPAAAWLLGSGLLGLFGIARRRSVTAA